MTNTNKSLAVRLVSEHADSLALKLKDFDSLAANIDKNFEATADDKGNVTIVRKGTQQVIPETLEGFFKMVARHHVSDLSFGKFRSQFQNRETNTEEKSKVKALLDHSKFHFNDQAKRERVEAFIMQNFVPDGKELRRLKDGMVSSKAFAPDEIIKHYAGDIVDNTRTELLRLERIAEIRDKANWLANGEAKTAERLLKSLQELDAPQFGNISVEVLQKQDTDLQAKALAHLGLLSKQEATLQELNQIEIRKKQFYAAIDELPVFTPN